MNRTAVLDIIKERLVEVYDPIAVILFGSLAWGNSNLESDIDILVIVPESNEEYYKRPIKGYHALRGIKESIDVIVLTRKEFLDAAGDPASLFNKIKLMGIRLYEAA